MSLLSYVLQSFVWQLYDQDNISLAIIFQALIILCFITYMALAVGVMFACFYNRKVDFKSWVACGISGFVILGALISIIESTTSNRTDGKSYGWPFGRDYRQFAHRGDVSFVIDRLLDNGAFANEPSDNWAISP